MCQDILRMKYRIMMGLAIYNKLKGGGLMYEEFTQNRIAQLRMQKDVSARDMSLSLGQNNSYINQIENRKALPSLQGLFYICEYFGISPQQFFDESNESPVQLAELVDDLKKLDASTLSHISAIVRDILSK